MLDRFSWHYKLIEKILDFVRWYFKIHNYSFTIHIIYKPYEKNK